MIQEALSFDDLLLVPKYSEIRTRKEIGIGSFLPFPTFNGVDGGVYLNLPIISSPMDTITETAMATTMDRLGGLGIIHRYCSIEKQVLKTGLHIERYTVGAAIGVVGDFKERAKALIDAGVNIICIDVAHGDSILVKEAIEEVRKIDEYVHIMAGNVATGDGFVRLAEWGADSIRVGIGGGSICSTRLNTGFGVPNMSAIFDCVNAWKKHNTRALVTEDDGWPEYESKNLKRPSLIIDGGIKNAGDMVKALAAGADYIMCGSLLAGTDETPGEIVFGNQKVYRGMASRKAQTDFKGSSSAPEGITTTVPYKGPVEPILNDLAGNIRSGFSYAGARNLKELQAKAEFVKQTSAGQLESFTHILKK